MLLFLIIRVWQICICLHIINCLYILPQNTFELWGGTAEEVGGPSSIGDPQSMVSVAFYSFLLSTVESLVNIW